MKILHVLNTATFSGAENVAVTIIKNLDENCNAAYASRDGSIKNKLLQENIKYYPMNNMSMNELNKVISDYNPDVIHAHDFTTSVMAAFTNTKIPIISHLHNNVPWLKQPGFYSIIYLLSSLRFKKILGVSKSIFEEYIFGNIIKKKCQVISNPINISAIKDKSTTGIQNEYDVIFLGRLAKEKNPLKFIDLMEEVKKYKSNLKIAMIGTGNLKEKCESKIKELELEKNIDLLGFMENPYGILSKSKILCMTSAWEGFGLVAVEALSLGVPVVANPVGGLTQIINKKCGLLTSDNQEYIHEVTKLLENNEYWNDKSKNAYKRAEVLDNIKEYMDELSAIYKEITMNS